MAKADRLERLDTRRSELETEYRDLLVHALQKASAGSWGLFGHNPKDRAAVAKWTGPVEELCDLGQAIDKMRDDLGLEPFALHQEFEASLGPVAATAPGEPKQARAWLDRLGLSADASDG
ncbi:MAG: hypothetical protein ABIM50_12280 [Novosphingobium sp.]